MASTYAPVRAFDFCKRSIKNMPLEQIQAKILDDVSKMMWMAAPWRWSIGTLTAITLVSTTQDYTLTTPTDFLYILHSFITDGSGVTRHLEPQPVLPAAVGVNGIPVFIAAAGANTWRVSPKPGTLTGTPQQIFTYYKKTSPAITAKTLMTAGVQVFDDEWFWVYEQGVLWQAYLYGDDQRAGSANIDLKGNVTYTGQKAVFEASLNTMRQREPMPEWFNRVAQDQKETTK